MNTRCTSCIEHGRPPRPEPTELAFRMNRGNLGFCAACGWALGMDGESISPSAARLIVGHAQIIEAHSRIENDSPFEHLIGVAT